jgi:hypothetical protein
VGEGIRTSSCIASIVGRTGAEMVSTGNSHMVGLAHHSNASSHHHMNCAFLDECYYNDGIVGQEESDLVFRQTTMCKVVRTTQGR